MDIQAKHIRKATWHVWATEIQNDAENVVWEKTVAVQPGGTESDAIALATAPKTDRKPTPEQEQAARAIAVKGECRALIVAVLDQYTLSNIQGAAIAGELGAAEMDLFKAGRGWVAAMQAACRAAIVGGDDPVWPDVPKGVAELAAQY